MYAIRKWWMWIRALESYSTEVTVYDPWANPEEV